MHTELRPRTSSSWQRWFVVGLACFFVAISVHYSLKATKNRSAIVRWYDQIQSVEQGLDAYELYNYPNPPIMALVLTPLTWLPPFASALCWFYLKVGMTLLALRWVFRLVESSEQPFPPWAKALTILLSLGPITGDLEHGNVNLFILFLVVGALYLFHWRRDFAAGVVLALAVACKVTPALFVPYFLWKRAWKSLVGCGVGILLFLWLVPGSILGWETNQRDLHSWAERMIKPYVVGGEVTPEHNNQSLPGLATRLLTASPSFSTFVDNVYTPTEWHNVAALDRNVLRWLVKGCALLFGVLVIWACRTPTTPRQGWRLAAEFSLIVLGMLLFSERTWKHHCVTFVLPFGVLSYYLAVCRPGPRLRAYLIASLASCVLLMATTSTSLWQTRTAKLAQVYGAYVWIYLILAAALVVLLRQTAESRAETLALPERSEAAA
jgi:hypothetical protein